MNLPLGAIVETNAVFSGNSVRPVMSGKLPSIVASLVARVSFEQIALLEAINHRSFEEIFAIFCNDPLVTCSISDAKELFYKMVANTSDYLKMYR